jgi:hypothetical protein
VGEIVHLQDGLVTVAWADGLKSAMGPEEIYVVSRDDEDMHAPLEGESDYDSELDGSMDRYSTPPACASLVSWSLIP